MEDKCIVYLVVLEDKEGGHPQGVFLSKDEADAFIEGSRKPGDMYMWQYDLEATGGKLIL